MPIVRILLVLLALVSPALAQDGARDAAAARDAAQAFRVYVEGVAKKGERPDLTRPEVAALLDRIFDLVTRGRSRRLRGGRPTADADTAKNEQADPGYSKLHFLAPLIQSRHWSRMS